MNFVVGNPVPTITSLAPTSVAVGAAAQTLTINGTGFLSTSTVSFNGTTRTTTFLSSTSLTIALTTTDTGTAGTYAVTVTNPAPGGGTSSAMNFSVGNPVPTITSLSPSFCCGRRGGANSDHHRHGLLEYFDGELQRLNPHHLPLSAAPN